MDTITLNYISKMPKMALLTDPFRLVFQITFELQFLSLGVCDFIY